MATTNEMEWADAFARTMNEIGAPHDMGDLLDWAYEVFPQRGNQNPAVAATEEWAAAKRAR